MSLFVRENHTVVDVAFAFADGTQLALQQGFAQRCNIIDKNMALQMFILMLYDAGSNTFKNLFVFLEVLVEVFDANFVGTHHLFINMGQAKAAFLERLHFAGSLQNLGVDESLLEVLGSRIVGIEGVAVDEEELDGLVDLRGGKANAFGMGQGLPHVLYQRLKLRIVGRDGLGDGLQRGVTVCYDG